MNNSKTCVLCTNKIAPYQKLCYRCYAAYKQYINTQWFKEISDMENKQDQINAREFILFDHTAVTAVEGKITPFSNPSKRGRPSTDTRIIDMVLEIYDNHKPISVRKIEQALGNKVSYRTILNIINKYRCEKK